MNTENIKIMVKSYLECASWVDRPDESLTWNDKFSQDFSQMAKDEAFHDCTMFYLNIELGKIGNLYFNTIDLSNQKTLEQLGHDFWLTRNGHGAGFWDGKDNNEWSLEDGDKLTEICNNNFKELSLWINDDNQVEFEG